MADRLMPHSECGCAQTTTTRRTVANHRLQHPGVHVAIALAIGGACVCGLLLKAQGGGWSADPTGSGWLLRLCEPQRTTAISCSAVVGSRWGSFDFSVGSRRFVVPTSFVGFAYFVAIGVWLAVVMRQHLAVPWARRWTLAALSVGLAVSGWLLGLMAFSLASWCPPCVAVHVINIVMFGAGALAVVHTRRQLASAEPRPSVSRVSRSVGLAMGVSLSLVCGAWLYYDAVTAAQSQWRKVTALREIVDGLQNDAAFVLREFNAQLVSEKPVGRTASVGQPHGADIVVFTDYDCGACACFDVRWRSAVAEAFGGRARIEYRHVPGASEGDGGDAARAAEAARLQGGEPAFMRMHQSLLAHRLDRPTRDFHELARLAGLDVDRLVADMFCDQVQNTLMSDATRARQLGVTAAPAIFLNDRRVPDLCVDSPVFWKTMFEQLHADTAVASMETPLVSSRMGPTPR